MTSGMKTDTTKPTEEFLRNIDIHELLPQQEPFVMVGALIHFDLKKTVTQTVVKPDNIFVEDGFLSAEGLMENIAQTCAARIGYVNKYILEKGIQIGFIGAVRDMKVIRLPKTGDIITTEVEVMEEVFGVILAKAQVTVDEQLLVTTEMKIALKEDN